MLIQILGCPNWKTSKTLVVATTALIETTVSIQGAFSANTKARGSLTFSKLE